MFKENNNISTILFVDHILAIELFFLFNPFFACLCTSPSADHVMGDIMNMNKHNIIKLPDCSSIAEYYNIDLFLSAKYKNS